MPTFRTQPSRSLGSSIRNLLATGGGKLTPLMEAQVEAQAAQTAQHLGLAEKARQEAESMRKADAQRSDPAVRTEYAAHSAGIDLPDATRLMGAIRGQLEQPGPADIDDAAAVGRDAQPYPMAKPNITPGAERGFRSALAATLANTLATGKTNAAQLADAAGTYQTNAITQAVQDAIAKGDVQTASAMSQGAKPGTAIKLHENIGNTGATFAPATGDVASSPTLDPDNTLLARSLAEIAAKADRERAAAVASRAAAGASTAHARLYETQAGNERATGGQGKAPAGYRWGPPDAAGNPTLVKITGGPAEDKATSSDAERISAGYANRMLASAKIMGELEKGGTGKPEYMEALLSKTPIAGKAASNAVMSDARQKYRQAQEDWVRSKLRKESGAVIAEDEMDREIRVYFPQIGDSDAVMKQKADSRKVAEEAMVQSGGRAFKAGGTALGQGWGIRKL